MVDWVDPGRLAIQAALSNVLAMTAGRLSHIPGARSIVAPAGTVLFRPDDACLGFIAVHAGTIRVSLTGHNGREIVLYRVLPGQICLQTFACLAEGRAYSAEGVAETDVRGELIAVERYHALLASDAEFRSAILSAIAVRFADFEHLVELLALTSVASRLAGALLALADDEGRVAMTHDALAREIGTAREVVSRQLARFERAGLVHLGRGNIRLASREALERKAADA